MLTFEQFKFFCNCGEELMTDKDRKATCSKCKKDYEIVLMPQKYLIPKEKETKQIATID